MVMYYIVLTYKDEAGTDTECGNVAARSKGEAYKLASDNYRKERNLKTNVHINNKCIYESSDPQKADEFYNLFVERVREEQNAARGVW